MKKEIVLILTMLVLPCMTLFAPGASPRLVNPSSAGEQAPVHAPVVSDRPRVRFAEQAEVLYPTAPEFVEMPAGVFGGPYHPRHYTAHQRSGAPARGHYPAEWIGLGSARTAAAAAAARNINARFTENVRRLHGGQAYISPEEERELLMAPWATESAIFVEPPLPPVEVDLDTPDLSPVRAEALPAPLSMEDLPPPPHIPDFFGEDIIEPHQWQMPPLPPGYDDLDTPPVSPQQYVLAPEEGPGFVELPRRTLDEERQLPAVW